MTEKTAFEKWWINNEYRFGQNPYHTASEAWNYQQQQIDALTASRDNATKMLKTVLQMLDNKTCL